MGPAGRQLDEWLWQHLRGLALARSAEWCPWEVSWGLQMNGEGRSFQNQGDVERSAKLPSVALLLITPSSFRSWSEPARPPGDIHPAGMHPSYHPSHSTEAPEEGPDWSGVALEVHRLVEMVCGHWEVLSKGSGPRLLVLS